MNHTTCIIGIGRVGLPMALVLADIGHIVYGIDRDSNKIERLCMGEMPFMEEGAEPLLKEHIGHNFKPTASLEVIGLCDTIILTLGTPIDENMNPVLKQIDEALNNILPHLKKGQLIILRSTVSPRTTLYVKDKIELRTQWKVGQDVFVAFCPERIAEGKAVHELKELPQIIGGVDEESSKKAEQYFQVFGVTCHITDSISAELAKLFTNMYRYITFGIANEFMVIAESFDRSIHEIRDLVNVGYKRGGLALPGLTAGPCLFKDGFFLVNENPFLDLITASWKINESMPMFLLKKIRERTSLKTKKVAIFGLAFKPDLDDIRESLSFKFRKGLMLESANIVLHDPHVKYYRNQIVLGSIEEALAGVDVLIIATRHTEYEKDKDKILDLLGDEAIVCDIWNLFGYNKIIFSLKEVRSKKVTLKAIDKNGSSKTKNK